MTYARIKMLHARKVNETVIFRRGPSKWVQLLKWNTDKDEITPGQWLNGRIYADRADLSPYGNYLIYFAAKFKDAKKQYAWTAISKPPYLTAIALWKKDDTFNGGGLFESSKKVYLSHTKSESKLEEGFNIDRLQVRIKEKRFPFDDIEGERMKRDGWIWSTQKDMNLNSADVQYSKSLNEKTNVVYVGKNKSKYEYSENRYNWKTFIQSPIGIIDVSDYENIDANLGGRILMSKNGCIYACDSYEDFMSPERIRLIVNLNGNKPYKMETPNEMKIW